MRNKITIKYLTIVFLLLLTVGCEDVIQVDLNDSEPVIVIEGEVIENNNSSKVLITKSTDFYKPGVYQTISGAKVLLRDSEGNSFDYNETSPGVYESSNIPTKFGIEYSLEVVVEGKTYNAVSTMPNSIILDSLRLEKAPDKPKEEGLGRFFLHVYFQDHFGIAEYCRFKLYNNGVQLSGFNIYYDKLTDGNYIDYRLILDATKNDIQLGDTLTVELMSIDEAAFNFYKTASSINASATTDKPHETSVAPANPVTNWNNKALGFFSAFTVSEKSIIMKL